jgi:cell division transport system ATP-binding protein
VIETSHLSKLYDRGVYALRDVSLRVEKGEFVFLTGPSGAGKSTFLRLLLRQDTPSEGRVSVAGRDLARLSSRQVQTYRRSLGFVFQDFKLIPTKTVLENVALVPRVLGANGLQQQRRTFQVMKWVGLQHRLNAHPPELSGGEQQRVAIARALVNKPEVLLADEPTGNLDSETTAGIIELLIRHTERHGTTMLMVTRDHEMSERCAHRILQLRDGMMTG